MPNVFVPQSVTSFNMATQQHAPRFDFSHAATFGELKLISREFEDAVFVEEFVEKAKNAMQDATEDDYLIAVGDPTMIAVCTGILARRFGKLNLLKWDRQQRRYLHMRITIDGNGEQPEY